MRLNARRIVWCVLFFYIWYGGQTLWAVFQPDPCHYSKPWLCEP